jgi:hypothetical protein
MKKEATSKNTKGLIQKTSDGKSGNSETQGAQSKRSPMKKEETPKKRKQAYSKDL